MSSFIFSGGAHDVSVFEIFPGHLKHIGESAVNFLSEGSHVVEILSAWW